MKNRGIPALILITALFFVLLIGYSLGNAHRSEIAVSVSPDLMTAPPAETTSATSAEVSPPPPKAVQPTQETFVVTFLGFFLSVAIDLDVTTFDFDIVRVQGG